MIALSFDDLGQHSDILRLRSWVGPMAATCAWTFVGSVTASTGRAHTQKNWSTSYSGWQPQTSSETRVDPHPDISFPHFSLRREPAHRLRSTPPRL
jgi:heme A synthase